MPKLPIGFVYQSITMKRLHIKPSTVLKYGHKITKMFNYLFEKKLFNLKALCEEKCTVLHFTHNMQDYMLINFL